MSSRSVRRQRQLARNEQGSLRVTTAAQYYRSGPLPEPSDLERYNDILPGAAERLMTMVEQQATHRMSLENRVIDGGQRRAILGLVGGFILAVVALLIGAYLTLNGRDSIGVGIMIADVAVLVSSYVYGDVRGRRERQSKR